MSGEERTIAVARHYAEVVAACRKRLAELEITHETLDAIAGLQSGYAGKLLCEPPIKRMGPLTMFLVFEALGMQVAFQEDTAALGRVKTRLVRRMFARRIHGRSVHKPMTIVLQPDILAKGRRRGGENSRKYMSRRQAKRLAREAARIRWSKARAADTSAKAARQCAE